MRPTSTERPRRVSRAVARSTVYCARATVTRGQMAAFLHRTRDPGRIPAPLPDAGPLPACTYEDVPTARTSYDQWQRTLLDTIHALPTSYRPPDLVDTSTAGANGGFSIRAIARSDLAAMVSAARSAGRSLRIVSAYRSYEGQVATFNDWVARSGLATALRRSARPGHSEHQLGTTIDFTHAGGAVPWSYADWATHPAGAWMRDNAWRYGWLMSYPEGRLRGGLLRLRALALPIRRPGDGGIGPRDRPDAARVPVAHQRRQSLTQVAGFDMLPNGHI